MIKKFVPKISLIRAHCCAVDSVADMSRLSPEHPGTPGIPVLWSHCAST